MRFIFRREETVLENFLLWQTKSGKLIVMKEVKLTALFLVTLLVWIFATVSIGHIEIMLWGCLVWAIPFFGYNFCCNLLPVKRPFR